MITAMRVHECRLLHWLLVISLALLPLRAVVAVPACDIHDRNTQDSLRLSVHAMHEHGAHAVVMMHAQAEKATDGGMHDNACCCCDIGTRCDLGCDMSLHATPILQSDPVLTRNFTALPLVVSSDSLHSRILTPPSRPPLDLQHI